MEARVDSHFFFSSFLLDGTRRDPHTRNMPRHARWRLPGVPLHVVHRGNNRAACFDGAREHELYLGLMREMSERHHCAIHAYVLMTNHVHLLVTPDGRDDISNFMKQVAQRYTRFVNKQHGRTGTLWEGRFKSSLVDSEQYLLRCHRYIEMNPVRAGMVDDPGKFPWSSYSHNAMGEPSLIVKAHERYLALGRTHALRVGRYRALFDAGFPEVELMRIRRALAGGDPIGSDAFVARVERMMQSAVDD